VVGVWPWRTKRTSVGLRALGIVSVNVVCASWIPLTRSNGDDC
jgi:hypothetical protein